MFCRFRSSAVLRLSRRPNHLMTYAMRTWSLDSRAGASCQSIFLVFAMVSEDNG